MKVVGIGNAIVDVICKVNDEFLVQNGLTKSTMVLLVKPFCTKNSSFTLQITSTIAFPIPTTFIIYTSPKNLLQALRLF
jgi:sugar/nucleoside kinase (ribokinase family)